MSQTEQEVFRIVSSWVALVAGGKKHGREYLQKHANGSWVLGGENAQLVTDYLEKHFQGFISMPNLDAAIRNLEKGNQLVGQTVAPIDRDISKGSTNKSSEISLESTNGIRAILEKYLKARTSVDESRDKQEADRKREFIPLPRRKLTQKEMHAASAEQLREWNRWNNGSGERQGGDLR